ncbi:MAG: hypothetical protein Q9210_002600 [Variospora velana]
MSSPSRLISCIYGKAVVGVLEDIATLTAVIDVSIAVILEGKEKEKEKKRKKRKRKKRKRKRRSSAGLPK